MAKYFGTDGIRGLVNEELTPVIAYKLGEYLGYTFKGKKLIIGSDTRISKDMFMAALSAGITSMGANVDLVGVVSTPAVSYLIKSEKYAAGIMISASHNPYYDNGLKVFNDNGEKICEELELEIEKYLDDEIKITYASNDELGIVRNKEELCEKYLDYLVSTSELDLSNYKILVDCANGSSSFLASKLFEKLGINATIINNNPDGYNINSKCGSTHLESLQENVKKDAYDLGIAYDGDADRVLSVLPDGSVVDGDVFMYICSKYLKAKNKLNNDTLVTTIMSNIGLYKALDIENIKYEKTKVGDKYVYENMLENDHSLGGEQSGHIIFKEHASTGDGMLSSIQLLNAIKFLNKGFVDLVKEIDIFPQLLENIRVKDKDVVLSSKVLKDAVDEVEKDLAGNGRVLLRASGTEPLIRVMVEASSDEICKEKVSYLISKIEEVE